MIRATLLGTAILMTLTGCARVAESRFNPLNWFGSSQAAPAPQDTELRPLVPQTRTTIEVDNRPLITTVSTMTIDRTTTGAIVRATGVAPTQGFFNAELVSRGIENGVLTLDFRAQAPADFGADGSVRSRQISAAYILDRAELASIRSVRVQGATDARVSRR